MPTIIDQLLHSPRLPAYLAQMNAVPGFEIPIAAIFDRDLLMPALRGIVAARPE